MPEFAYKARSSTGESVAGTIVAASKRDALCALGKQLLFPTSVEAARVKQPAWKRSRKIKTQILATNLSQLADLLQSGVPLLRALHVLSQQATHPLLEQTLKEVHDGVAEGSGLDEALARHPQVFNELTVSMVRAGTEGAFLEDALKRTADFLEKQEELKGRVIGAMTYPAILAIAGFTVTVVLIVFFVPKFAELFAKLDERGGLPVATVWLLALSHVLGRYGLLLVGAAAVGVAVLRRKMKSDKGRMFFDRYKIKLPVVGKIFLGTAVSRFCRVLGTLLKNGVPLLRALDISSESSGNRVLAQAVRASAQNVSSGQTLARPLAECGLFPRPVMAMISVAEESNNLDAVLVNVADSIDRQIERQLDLMVRLVEPLMLLIMASVILFVLVALLMPVFEMSATVG